MDARRAFSLVELLVVVTIIIALLAILMPSMGKAVRIAQTAQCASNQHQIGLGLHSYASDHFGGLPSVGYWSYMQAQMYVMYNRTQAGSPHGWNNLGLLVPYGAVDAHSDLFFCPLQTAAAFNNSDGDIAHPNALPRNTGTHSMFPADQTKYGWTNARSGWLRRSFGEGPMTATPLRNASRGALFADVFSTYGAILASHGDSINVAYADASVTLQTVDTDAVPEYLLVGYSTVWNDEYEVIWKSLDHQ